MWMDRFGIDGLRLDAADCLDLDFLNALQGFTKARRSDFWLMGEVVHGNYRQWANLETLDTVTNYETYKALYSSLIEGNYHEVAYALNRQFGPDGLYRDLWLYNFVDNHDVDRVASKLQDPGLLYPLYLLLFTMPGIPSIYYGSEWGIKGQKQGWSDAPLRPALDLNHIRTAGPQPDLLWDIQRLAKLRKEFPSLQSGDYQQVLVKPRQFAFQRQLEQETIVIALNSDQKTARVDLPMSQPSGTWVDVLNGNERFVIHQGRVQMSLPGKWGRVLKLT
jgi:glycosidase